MLTLIDMWDEQQLLDKQQAEPSQSNPGDASEPTKTTTDAAVDLDNALIGTWVSPSDGETYAFNADGTAYQIYEGVTYEYTYTVDDAYVEIFYVEYDSDGFYIEIDDDTLIIAGYYTYIRLHKSDFRTLCNIFLKNYLSKSKPPAKPVACIGPISAYYSPVPFGGFIFLRISRTFSGAPA